MLGFEGIPPLIDESIIDGQVIDWKDFEISWCPQYPNEFMLGKIVVCPGVWMRKDGSGEPDSVDVVDVGSHEKFDDAVDHMLILHYISQIQQSRENMLCEENSGEEHTPVDELSAGEINELKEIRNENEDNRGHGTT